MKILFDTQAFLWAEMATARLSRGVLARINDTANERLLSAASSWEIAMKHARGRLALPVPPDRYIPERMERGRINRLAIEHEHAIRAAELPQHHRDPFDRILIAQAQLEGLTILTSDPTFDRYDVEVMWTT